MPSDYRYKPFDDVLEPVAIMGETHIIPSNSPYTIRLCEVPVKDDPSSLSLTIDGAAASEVAANPAQGEFWPDYSTGADGDENWNTGLIQFNASDAGKTVVVNYNGIGRLASADYRGHQLFTANGIFTVPKGVDTVYISGCGGGGGGKSGYYTTDGDGNPNAFYCRGSGGAGACAYKTPLTVVPGQSYNITIGAGGTSSPTAGGTTSFGFLLSLSGGGAGGTTTAGSSGGAFGTSGSCIASDGIGGSGLFGSGGHPTTNQASATSGSGYGSGGGSGAGGGGGAGAQGFILVEW